MKVVGNMISALLVFKLFRLNTHNVPYSLEACIKYNCLIFNSKVKLNSYLSFYLGSIIK